MARLDTDGPLLWHTFLGGSSTDYGDGVAVDESGNVTVVGQSFTSWGISPIRAYTDSSDAFVARLDNNGTLLWNTFLGGSEMDHGYGVVVDGSGDLTVAGGSSGTWGTIPIRAYTADSDAFVARLDSDGVLQWNTFLGGSESDGGRSVMVDGSGGLTVAGWSGGTWGTIPIRAYSADLDAVVARLDSDGALQWYSFLGGSGYDRAWGVAVDSGGNAIVVGDSTGTWGTPTRPHTGNYGAFVAQLDAAGTLRWNAFLAGSGNDYGQAVAVDGSGNVVVAGYSNATWGAPINPHSGIFDAFVARDYWLPKMDVQGNATAIEPGDSTPSPADHTDLGSADVDSETVSHIFAIQSTGAVPLVLTGSSPYVAISGDHAGDFSVLIAPASSIPAGGVTAFLIAFEPSAAGLRAATVSIANNDPTVNPFDFAIQGTGLAVGIDTQAVFRVDERGRVFADGTVRAAVFASGFADIAEWVTVSEPVEAGDVLELDPTAFATYRLSRTDCSSLVAGVVSTQPAVVLGSAVTDHSSRITDHSEALLALTGIVPVKVTDEGGPILLGDLLVTSSTPGHATRWGGGDPCVFVGKALEPMTDATGVILVLLTVH